MLNIAFNIDSNYVKNAKVTLYSLLKNTKRNISLNVLTFEKGIDLSPLEELKVLFPNFKELHLHELSEESIAHTHDSNSFLKHVSMATYGRLFIPTELKHLDKVIYLDTDMIINADIVELWETKIGPTEIGGVKEPWVVHFQRFFVRRRYPYIKEQDMSTYINAGLMVMNPKALNESNFTAKALEFAKKAGKIHFGDQDIVNSVKEGTVVIEPEWNSTLGRFFFYRFAIYHNHKLVHYVTAAKPWKKQLYYKALNYFLLGIKRTNMWGKYNKQMLKDLEQAK